MSRTKLEAHTHEGIELLDCEGDELDISELEISFQEEISANS